MFIILRQSSWLLVLGSAVTIVLISGGVDLSIGSTAAVCGIVAALMLKRFGLPGVAPAVALTLLTGMLLGALNGLFISRWRINPWLITLATTLSYRGLAYVIPQGNMVAGLPLEFSDFFSLRPLGIPMLVLIAIIVAVACHVILMHTVYGRHIKAIGSGEEAAEYCGIPVARYRMSVYILTGLFAGIAGLMFTGRGGAASPADNIGIELYVIAAVVIGGTRFSDGRGSILGTVLGVLFIASVLNGLILLRLNNSVLKMMNGVLIVAAVILDSLRRRLNT